MKWLLILSVSFLVAQKNYCHAQSDGPILGGKPDADWMTSYYDSPSPERFVEEVRTPTNAGVFNDRKSQPYFIAFLSQVMAQNPERVERWLKEFEDLDEKQRTVVLSAAWYSDTEPAMAYFQKKQLKAWAEQDAPSILKMKVNSPATLDMLWGHFMATGERKPIRRIVSAFQLSNYSGALKRLKESKQTPQDKKEAWFDATFQAAQWSLTSNCTQHPKVLDHCKAIFQDKDTPKPESVWLGLILSQVGPVLTL